MGTHSNSASGWGRRSGGWKLPCGLLVWLVLAIQPAAAKDRLLFDFEQEGLAADWSAVRNIRVARQPVADAPPAAEGIPGGSAVAVTTEGPGGFYSKSGRIPADWLKYRELTFWVFRSPDEAARRPVSQLEVQVLEADPRARFWRKVELSHEGWKQYTIPLRWMRWGAGRVPRWDHLDRLGFWFRDAADLKLDAVALVEGSRPRSAELAADELREVAFPGVKGDAIAIAASPDLVLLTNARALNEAQLTKHLEGVADAVFRELPFLPRPSTPVTLVVFSNREEYRKFVPRFAAQLNAAAAPPTSDGFTLQGVSTSSWDPQQGTLRPVYAHEYVHGLLSQAALVPNSGEWFQEGLATHFQMQFHPQKGLSRQIAQDLQNEAKLAPLADVCNGKKVALNQYWQALTVVDLLLAHESYRPQLPALVAAFQKSGSTDLGPQLEPVLHTTWPEFTTAWKEYCRKAHAATN